MKPKNIRSLVILLVLILLVVAGFWFDFDRQDADETMPQVDEAQILHEVAVVTIPLVGDVADQQTEVSGLAWYGENLIILPQYPERFPTDLGGSLFSIPKEQINAYLDGDNQAIVPQAIPFDDGGLGGQIPGFQGFEAVAFDGQRAYLTIEAETPSAVSGYLVLGELASDLSSLHVMADSLLAIEPQADISNFSEEAMLVTGESVLTFYEANGANVNPQPVAHQFDLDLQPMMDLAFPVLEYRLTDASALDAEGGFWVINYLYPGDIEKLELGVDEEVTRFGDGTSHAQSQVVERLLEFQYTPDVILRTENAPIPFELLTDGSARNWEGLARLDERGFLVMTDKFPETILGFVPYP